MTAVYIRIFIATRRRLRQRARASRLSAMAKKSTDCGGKKNDGDRDRSSISSIENNGNDGSGDHCLQKSNDSINQQKQRNRSAKHGNKGNHAATTAIIAGGGVSPAVGGEVVEPANKSSNSNASSEGILSVRIQGQLNADEAGPDGTKLSPANLSEESVTDAEIPLHQHRPHSHSVRGEGGHGKSSHSSRGSKKPGRQTSQQVSQFVEEKQRISLSKERKAARTLGIVSLNQFSILLLRQCDAIEGLTDSRFDFFFFDPQIMGVFVVCWLPFFLMVIVCNRHNVHIFCTKNHKNVLHSYLPPRAVCHCPILLEL